MLEKRTDLALEAKELWAESAAEQTRLEGVEAREGDVSGYPTTVVRILDQRGETALGKPVGTYVTVELDTLARREEDAFGRGVEAISGQLAPLLELRPQDSVLVVGLGNADITPDGIGPISARHTMATRHLVDAIPVHFGAFRRISVLEPGVLGSTGIESAEVLRAVVAEIRPDKVVVIDALASRKLSRVCRTVQISDTGIVPGSGVGNSRAAINRETLGVPVIAVGVPTVVDAATLAADLLEQRGGNLTPEDFSGADGGSMIVTPKEIDTKVADISKLVGYSLNYAFHDGISIGDIDLFLS